MSSYNNIRKIKYTKNPSDVVSLQEYIIFEDSHAKAKYVVFKFSNNLNQRLLGLKFEVLQFDKDNILKEKSTVKHEKFVAEANEPFVPNAKLKINYECESLEVRLISASFDRVVWSDGEFRDNSYRFDSYAESVSKSARVARTAEIKKKSKDKKDKKENKKAQSRKDKNKVGYDIVNTFRRNRAVFPAVFNVFLCIALIGLLVFSAFYFKKSTKAFAIDGFVLKESSSGFVTIIDYAGKDSEIEIPSILETKNKSYSVSKIGKGAFSNSNVKGIEIKTEKTLVIETGAFVNCNKLNSVTSAEYCGLVTVMEGAFTNCKALQSFLVPSAELCERCFDGTDNIKNLVFEKTVYSGGKLLDIFNGIESIIFDYFPMYEYYYLTSPEFVEGVSVRR